MGNLERIINIIERKQNEILNNNGDIEKIYKLNKIKAKIVIKLGEKENEDKE